MSAPLSPDDIISSAGVELPLETAAQCLHAIAQMECDIAAISEQLILADTGERDDDPAWRLRAERALYFKRQAKQHLLARLGECHREERQARHAQHQKGQIRAARSKAQRFVLVAKEALPPKLFEEIWDVVNKRS